jgi:hypothetical protein
MRKRGRVRRFWAAVRRRIPGLRPFDPPPENPLAPGDDALVPVGPPRKPMPAAAAALEPPSEPDPLVYPTETDAVGTELPDEGEDDDSGGDRRAAL